MAGIIKKYWKGFLIGAGLWLVLAFGSDSYFGTMTRDSPNFPTYQLVQDILFFPWNLLDLSSSNSPVNNVGLIFIIIPIQLILWGILAAYIYHIKLGKK